MPKKQIFFVLPLYSLFLLGCPFDNSGPNEADKINIVFTINDPQVNISPKMRAGVDDREIEISISIGIVVNLGNTKDREIEFRVIFEWGRVKPRAPESNIRRPFDKKINFSPGQTDAIINMVFKKYLGPYRGKEETKWLQIEVFPIDEKNFKGEEEKLWKLKINNLIIKKIEEIL